jgi:H+-translocating NAD(P) transhydrogenase subunit beta
MPVLDVDKAEAVFFVKRSMAPGSAGIGNALCYKDNTVMMFGDASGRRRSGRLHRAG